MGANAHSPPVFIQQFVLHIIYHPEKVSIAVNSQ